MVERTSAAVSSHYQFQVLHCASCSAHMVCQYLYIGQICNIVNTAKVDHTRRNSSQNTREKLWMTHNSLRISARIPRTWRPPTRVTTIVCCLLGKASVTRWGPTILDRIKWNSKPPSPPNQGWENGAFWLLRGFILALGGWGFAVPFYSVQDCWSPPRHASLSKQTTDDRSHASW